MRLVAFALVALAVAPACGSKNPPAKPGDGSGSGTGPAPLAKRIAISWGIHQNANAADVFLEVTDETGGQVSHALGSFPGQCAVATAAAEMRALIAVDCMNGGTGVELQAVQQNTDVVIMRMRVDQGVKPDAMAREEVTRITAPPGAAIGAK